MKFLVLDKSASSLHSKHLNISSMKSQSPKPESPSMSNASKRGTQEKSSPSPDPHESSKQTNHESSHESNSTDVISPNSATAASQDAPQVSDLEPEREPEYNCQYCNKKFTNKQALGGHQNAHKLERDMEKNTSGMQMSPFGVHGSPLPYPGLMMAVPPLHGSFGKSHHFLNRNAVYRPYILPQPVHFPHPPVPMANDLCSSPPDPGLLHSYPRLIAPTPPGFSHFMTPSLTYIPNCYPTPHFAYMGQQGSSRTMPVSVDSIGSISSMLGQNAGGRNDRGPENQIDEDSGLDLSLRL